MHSSGTAFDADHRGGARDVTQAVDLRQRRAHVTLSRLMGHDHHRVFLVTGIDWKGLGYLVSILSVFLLGAVAWPKPEDPTWHLAVLIVGMAVSIVGMAFRYKAHLDQQRELRQIEADELRRR